MTNAERDKEKLYASLKSRREIPLTQSFQFTTDRNANVVRIHMTG